MKQFLDPWVIAGSILSALVLLGALLWVMGPIDRTPAPEFEGRAVITIIPRPTETPRPTATPLPITPTPEPGTGIQVEAFVKVQGTGGEGVRLREQPSLEAETNYLGVEDEIFRVVDGPREEDGYLWWKLEAPANSEKTGWAVSNYLVLDQAP